MSCPKAPQTQACFTVSRLPVSYRFVKFATILCVGAVLLGCTGQLVRRPVVEELNRGYAGTVFQARRDITITEGPQPDVLFTKGTKLRVWLEGRADWVKLRAYRAETPREQARAAVILYIFVEDLPPESSVAAETAAGIREYLALKLLVERIAENLAALDQKEAPKRR